MTEIEKMFENANIKQDRMCEWTCKDSENCNLNCKHYGSMQLYYPSFTAEKQLELIKWLSKRRLLNITFCENKNTYQLSNNKCTGSFCSDLATAVVTLVQCELDFCTEEEKEEIRGILNENS